MSCQDGCAKNKIDELNDCARVVRAQREVVFKNHEWFRETVNITFFNECTHDLNVVCIDRRIISLNLHRQYGHAYAPILRAYDEDGSQLNVLSSHDSCLLHDASHEYICLSVPPLKPHSYYTVTLVYEGKPDRYEDIPLLSFLVPYYDVSVTMWHFPPGRAPSKMPQSLYMTYRTENDWLEIDQRTAKKVLKQATVSLKKEGKIDPIALDKHIFSYRVEFPANHIVPPIAPVQSSPTGSDASDRFQTAADDGVGFSDQSKPTETGSNRSEISGLTWLKLYLPRLILFLLRIWIYHIDIRLTLNRFYKLFAWSLLALSVTTMILSAFLMQALFVHEPQSVVDDGLFLLTALFVLFLGNYLELPKDAPLKYNRVIPFMVLAIASVVALSVMLIWILAHV